jgi:putative ABC transport system permease protein
LFGLAALSAVNRTKEVGIRKVLGASLTTIVRLLSFDFIKLVGIALAVSSPLAWYFMHSWLQNFAYRIHIGWLVFALAGGFGLIISFFTVATQALRAALRNPVDSLRSE